MLSLDLAKFLKKIKKDHTICKEQPILLRKLMLANAEFHANGSFLNPELGMFPNISQLDFAS